MQTRHCWTKKDDLVALYLCRFGDERLSVKTKAIGETLGMGAGSLRMRIGNFRVIAGKQGLDNYARQSKEVFDRFSECDETVLRRMVEETLPDGHRLGEK